MLRDISHIKAFVKCPALIDFVGFFLFFCLQIHVIGWWGNDLCALSRAINSLSLCSTDGMVS